MSARDYLMALAGREEHRRAFVTALADVDALLTPTAQTAAIPIAKVDQSGTAAFFTRAGNYLGLCGLALPNGFTADGLPTSLQILCHAGREATALRIGWATSNASEWKERRPAGSGDISSRQRLDDRRPDGGWGCGSKLSGVRRHEPRTPGFSRGSGYGTLVALTKVV